MKFLAYAVLTGLCVLSFSYTSAEPVSPATMPKETHKRYPVATSAAFDSHGRLWRIRYQNAFLLVDYSGDLGKTFSTPVRVNAEPEDVHAEAEARPEIIPAANGHIYVSWTKPLAKPYTGDIRFSRSTDGGKTFETPQTVNDNREEITHRFQSMHVAPDGKIFIAWIDKREMEAAKSKQESFRGASIFYAVSNDKGASFQANQKHSSHTCECCRLAVSGDTDGHPVLFWRHVFEDGTRDHALARLGVLSGTEGKTIERVTTQFWKINACPHHGPALSIGADGTRHLVWFNVAEGEPGLMYQARTRDGKPLAPPAPLGNEQASHPDVLASGSQIALAWKEFDGTKTHIMLKHSNDKGQTWHNVKQDISTVEASDYPRLLSSQHGNMYLSWFTVQEGYRLIEINGDNLISEPINTAP